MPLLHRLRIVDCRLAVLAIALCAPFGVGAQTAAGQPENVSVEYAQVLRVQPVYETLRATRMEQRCTDVPADEPEERQAGSAVSRLVGSVKRVFGKDDDGRATVKECVNVPVRQELRRPVAYDVDYVYKGTKYRSRLPQDPGNRLRIKVSVTPLPAGQR